MKQVNIFSVLWIVCQLAFVKMNRSVTFISHVSPFSEKVQHIVMSKV